jgi:hypothetical protein
MNPSIKTSSPVSVSPVLPGIGTLSLRRAVLQTSPDQDPATYAEDLGMGVVVSQDGQGGVELLELGSGRLRTVTVEGPVVILGWVLLSTFERLQSALAEERSDSLSRLGWALALRVLEQNGFNAVTRSIILRMGFRDVVRDLDPHEGAAVRLLLDGGGVARIALDPESAGLRITTGKLAREPRLEEALQRAFPSAELLAEGAVGAAASQAYLLSFRLPGSVTESRKLVADIRRGIVALLQEMEPRRHQALREHLDVFGARDSLAHLQDEGRVRRLEAVEGSVATVDSVPGGSGRVH